MHYEYSCMYVYTKRCIRCRCFWRKDKYRHTTSTMPTIVADLHVCYTIVYCQVSFHRTIFFGVTPYLNGYYKSKHHSIRGTHRKDVAIF